MKDQLIQSFKDLFDAVTSAAPKVIVGIVLLVLAVVVAKVIEKVLRLILVRLRFDSLVEKVGIDQTLQKLGIRQQLNQSIPRLVYFLLLFLFAKTAADVIGLVAISEALGSFFAYLPNLVAAVLLLLIGTAAADVAGRTVTQAAEESGIDFARPLGRMVTALILFIIGLMAISQLRIDTQMIRIVTSFMLGGMALGFGLSFGLGAREMTRNILAGFYARKILKVGENVQIGDEHGVLQSIMPTHTLIRQDDKTVSLANDRFLNQVTRQ